MNRTALQGLAAGTATLTVAALLASSATSPTPGPSAGPTRTTALAEDLTLARGAYGLDGRASRSEARVPALGPEVPTPPPLPVPVELAAPQPLAAAPRPQADEPGTVDRSDPQAIARSLLEARGWSGDWDCLDSLWQRESEWKVDADNPSSSAFGIPQALPGRRMASEGSDWATNPETQIRWGLGYIGDRYGDPCAAWAHSEERGWY